VLALFPDGHTRTVVLGATAPVDAAARLRGALADRAVAYKVVAQRPYQPPAFRPFTFQPLVRRESCERAKHIGGAPQTG